MKLNNGLFHSYGLLPKAVANYLHVATETELKVLIYIITMDDQIEIENKILGHFNLTENEFKNAVKFWVDKEILPKNVVIEKTKIKAKQVDISDITEMPEYTSTRISIEMETNNRLRALIMEGESILGKTLSPNDIGIIYGLYDWLKLPVEVIMMLMNFCVMQNKKSTKYMEKVAIQWAKEGICTVEEAENHIGGLDKKKEFTYRLRGMLQIMDRELTPSEKTMAQKWEAIGFSDELIMLAYEKTVQNTGKVAFAYMNTILNSWQQKGYTTLEQIGGEKKTGGKGTPAKGSPRFDYDEFERRSFEIIKQQNGGNN